MTKPRDYLRAVQSVPPASSAPKRGKTEAVPPRFAPPDRLSEAEAKVWQELAGIYGERIGEDDVLLFTHLVEHETEYRDARGHVTRVGKLIKTVNGNAVQNPYLAIANKAAEKVLKISIQLGLTPMARGRVKTVKRVSRASPFADLKTL